MKDVSRFWRNRKNTINKNIIPNEVTYFATFDVLNYCKIEFIYYIGFS